MRGLICLCVFLISLCQSRPLIPETQEVIDFIVDLTWEDANPTGVGLRKVIKVNGSFPGPPLYLEPGQKVKFLANNHLPNDTAIHFHGIGQRRTPWADGTPGISQDSIRPGASYLYEWYADEPGVYFYHAHERGQIMDGLYGAIVISASDDAQRPFHLLSPNGADQIAMRLAESKLQPLMISDWSQFTFEEFDRVQRRANIDYTCMDSIIINGAGSQYCLPRPELEDLMTPLFRSLLHIVGDPQLSDKACVPPVPGIQGDFDFDLATIPPTAYETCNAGTGDSANYTVTVNKADGWAALAMINPSGLLSLKVTIDNHPLYVYSVDGHYINPQIVDQIVVNPGDRIAFFVKLDQPTADYTIRIANNGLGQFLSGFGTLHYSGATGPNPAATPLINYAGNPIDPSIPIRPFSDLTASPFPPPPSPFPTSPSATHTFLTRKLGRPSSAYEWSLSSPNGTSRYNRTAEKQTPPLLFRDPSTLTPSPLLIKTATNTWVDLIIRVEGPFAQPHPIHKHGNKFFVLASGTGPFPYASVAEAMASGDLAPGTFNLENPPYRDSWTTPPGFNADAWVVLRYKVENYGAWLLHCHVQTHFSGGMAVAVLDGVDQWPEVPREYWLRDGFVDQSGGGGMGWAAGQDVLAEMEE